MEKDPPLIKRRAFGVASLCPSELGLLQLQPPSLGKGLRRDPPPQQQGCRLGTTPQSHPPRPPPRPLGRSQSSPHAPVPRTLPLRLKRSRLRQPGIREY